jgi:hypothetical protein
MVAIVGTFLASGYRLGAVPGGCLGEGGSRLDQAGWDE